MEVVLASLSLGLLIGWFPRTPRRFLKFSDRLVTVGLVPLMFAMGALLGIDPALVPRLKLIGLEAFTHAALVVAGSVAVVWIIERTFFPASGPEQEEER